MAGHQVVEGNAGGVGRDTPYPADEPVGENQFAAILAAVDTRVAVDRSNKIVNYRL
ncbi:MAG: hypothetical protein ACC645_14920 [Pirellulales bacterium]